MKLLKLFRNICVPATITTFFNRIGFAVDCVLTIINIALPLPAAYKKKYNLTYLLAKTAQEHSNIYIAKLLLACRAKINELSLYHDSPLNLAAISGNTAMAQLLINKGAHSLNQALYAAAYQGDPAMTSLLITHGANPYNPEVDLLEIADKMWGLQGMENEWKCHWYTQVFFDNPITAETKKQQFDDKEKVKTFLIQAQIKQVKEQVLPFLPVNDIVEIVARYTI